MNEENRHIIRWKKMMMMMMRNWIVHKSIGSRSIKYFAVMNIIIRIGNLNLCWCCFFFVSCIELIIKCSSWMFQKCWIFILKKMSRLEMRFETEPKKKFEYKDIDDKNNRLFFFAMFRMVNRSIQTKKMINIYVRTMLLLLLSSFFSKLIFFL